MEAIQEFDVNNNCAFYNFLNNTSTVRDPNGNIKITSGEYESNGELQLNVINS